MAVKRYVVGFAFSEDRQRVVLIRKERPEWAVGKLFPVGGHTESAETSLAAMEREFAEEAGVPGLPWEQYAAVEADGWAMECFRCFSNEALYSRTATDEQVRTYSVPEVLRQHALLLGAPGTLFHDSGWLMLLALDTFTKVESTIFLGNPEG